MSARRIHGYITLGILVGLLGASGIWYATSPSLATRSTTPNKIEEPLLYPGEHVVVNLTTMEVSLKNGTTTIATLPVITKGKPGSYYETIGGAYPSDYSIAKHFSTIGHVYMPWSVHVFGNFFIHGIPYYPNGTEVSSTYSGGCIRLSTADAKLVYNFVKRGTPIIVTEGTAEEFAPSPVSSSTIESIAMTRLMVATISLEVLTQDNEITDTDGETLTTRRIILPRLVVEGDDEVSHRFARYLGEDIFIDYMNQKAKALGLTNTSFSSVDSPAHTTPEDETRFMNYIAKYKTYLITLASSTELSSQ